MEQSTGRLQVDGDQDVALLDDVAGPDPDGRDGPGDARRAPGSPSSWTPAAPRCHRASTWSPGATDTVMTFATISATTSTVLGFTSHAATLHLGARPGAGRRAAPGRAPRQNLRLSSDGLSARAWSRPLGADRGGEHVVPVADLGDQRRPPGRPPASDRCSGGRAGRPRRRTRCSRSPGRVASVRQCSTLPGPRDPRRRARPAARRPGRDELAGQLGEAQVVAGHQPDADPADLDQHRLDGAGEQPVGLLVAEGVVEVDLAVRRPQPVRGRRRRAC